MNVCQIYSKVRPWPLSRGGCVPLITLQSINAVRSQSQLHSCEIIRTASNSSGVQAEPTVQTAIAEDCLRLTQLILWATSSNSDRFALCNNDDTWRINQIPRDEVDWLPALLRIQVVPDLNQIVCPFRTLVRRCFNDIGVSFIGSPRMTVLP